MHAHCVSGARGQRAVSAAAWLRSLSLAADTLVAKSEKSQGYLVDMGNKKWAITALDGAKYAIVFLDRGSKWKEFAPDAARNTPAAVKAMRQLEGPRPEGKPIIKQFHSDGARELTAGANEMKWVSSTSTPFLSQSNSQAERTIRLCEDGIRAILHRAGTPVRMWPLAGKYWCRASFFYGYQR